MTELLKEFEKEFEKAKKELKFKATLEELDDIFFLKDYISKEGYISNKLSRQVCRRIVDLYLSWGQYLHGLLIPNPNSIVNMTESNAFDEEEKQEMTKLLEKLMLAANENNLISLNKDREAEKEFIDGSIALWKEVKPKFEKITKKVNDRWEERIKAKPKKEDQEFRKIYG